jgi:2-C-methyl-D-erythritol 4-phosphate cytidylyltransferase
MIYAILLAAGTGTRLRQKQIKPLVLIKQKPVFLYTVDTFLKQSKINRIFLVVNPKYTNQYKK